MTALLLSIAYFMMFFPFCFFGLKIKKAHEIRFFILTPCANFLYKDIKSRVKILYGLLHSFTAARD